MASPDDPEATADASVVPAARRPLSDERIELPVYRPRRSLQRWFWLAFVLAALVAALVVWLVLA